MVCYSKSIRSPERIGTRDLKSLCNFSRSGIFKKTSKIWKTGNWRYKVRGCQILIFWVIFQLFFNFFFFLIFRDVIFQMVWKTKITICEGVSLLLRTDHPLKRLEIRGHCVLWICYFKLHAKIQYGMANDENYSSEMKNIYFISFWGKNIILLTINTWQLWFCSV